MVRIIFLLVLFSINSYAAECPDKTVYTKTDGSKVTLCLDSKREDLVTPTCLEDCAANKFTSAPIELRHKELAGGKDPHSVACTKQNGKLNLYRDENSNEYAFCEASDGSAISADLIEFKIK